MRRPLATAVLMLLAATQAVARADLNDDVRRELSALKGYNVAARVVRLGADRAQDAIIVDVNGDRPLIPASNLKVITTADALETLGEDFRFRTRLVLRGDTLAIVGDGDPTLGDSEYLAGTGWTITTVYENWAAELKRQGITRVARVVVDDSIFEETMVQPNWPTNQAHKDYVPQVAGLNLNANCLDVFVTREGGSVAYRIEPRTSYVTVQNTARAGNRSLLDLSRVLGSNRVLLRGEVASSFREPFRVTVHDPALFAGAVFVDVLKANGIDVASGDVTRDRTVRGSLDTAADGQPSWQLVAVNETPLTNVLPKTNKESINLYAEALAKRVAAQRFDQPGSWALLRQSQAAFLRIVGEPDSVPNVFDDGCGLSKENAVAPSAFTATLSYMFHGPHKQRYVDSMSVGGVDGTLQKRYAREGLVGRVFGKSGSVNAVTTLSGYLKGKDNTWYAFSILLNGVTNVSAAKQTQDAILKRIDNEGAQAPAVILSAVATQPNPVR